MRLAMQLAPLFILATPLCLVTACDGEEGSPPKSPGADDADPVDVGAEDEAVAPLPRRPPPMSSITLPTTAVDRTMLPPAVRGMVIAMDEAMWKCPNRVWPGLASFYREQTQILLVDVERRRAWLWNDRNAPADGPAVSTVAFERLPEEWSSTFNTGALNDVHTLGVNITGATASDVWNTWYLELLFHEAFHFQGRQPLWQLNGSDQSRAIPYPERWEPRYLRARMAQQIHRYVQNPDDLTALGHFAALARTFEASHSSDAERVRNTDIREGTATYAEAMSLAIAHLGCGASDERLIADIVANGSFALEFDFFAGGRESYVLGLWSSLALRMRRTVRWQAAVESGKTPGNVLIEGVTSIATSDDEPLSLRVRSAVEQRSAQTKEAVDSLLARMSARDHVRLAVPLHWLAGSFSTRGFLRLVEEPGEPEVILAMEGRFAAASGGIIEIASTVLRPFQDRSGCHLSDPHIVVAWPRTALREAADGWSSTDLSVRFTGLRARQLGGTEDSLTWLCPEPSTNASAPSIPPMLAPLEEHATNKATRSPL